MPGFVAILEDGRERVAEMRACLAEIMPAARVVVFENAQEMIGWLREHLGQVVLISLDHDLPVRGEAGRTVDCGTGRQVADYLASLRPSCPVIIHSSNDVCGQGMFFTLKDAGWACSRVYPCAEELWINREWAERVEAYAERPERRMKVAGIILVCLAFVCLILAAVSAEIGLIAGMHRTSGVRELFVVLFLIAVPPLAIAGIAMLIGGILARRWRRRRAPAGFPVIMRQDGAGSAEWQSDTESRRR